MDKEEYEFQTLATTYEGFLAPAFEVTVGGKQLSTAQFHFSSITVDIDAGESAGGCSFTIESQYDYKNSKWDNDLFSTIKVGAKLSIKAGYVTKKEVFFGFVDDYTIKYSTDSAPSVTVNGIDAKGYLMNAKDRKYMSEKSTGDVVKEILNECVSNGYAKEVTVGTVEDYNVELIQEDMDDYAFLSFLASSHGMNFFIVNGEIIFDNVVKNTKPVINLKMGLSLLSFSQTASLRNQVGKVVVYGIDPITMQPITGEASDVSTSAEGSEAGDIARGFEGIVEKETNMFVQTAEECKRLAQARFDQRALNFISGSGRCLGIPEIIPGRYIELQGMDSKSNGKYFIGKVTHEYNPEGYFTTFEVKGAKSK